jgi:hypothetical protein
MRWFTLLTVLAFVCNVNLCHAQQKHKTVTGQIRTVGNQQPVAGVSVQAKGTNSVSGSQEDGIYYIEVGTSDSTLVFTHPDFEPKVIRLTHETEYNVELKKKQH